MHVKRIERFTKQLIPVNVVEGYEPKKTGSAPRTSRPGGWKPGDNRGAAPSQASVRSASRRPRGRRRRFERRLQGPAQSQQPTIATAHVAATATVNPAR
jgi:hypothetical protein